MSRLDLQLSWENHRVRMVGTAESPAWIASDVCAVLDLRGPNPWKHLPHFCKGMHSGLTLGGWQKLVTINEQGLYRLIAVSRVPAVDRFRSWLFGEVLPSIRKHGSYPPPAKDLVIRGGRWVCMQSGEIIEGTDVAISGDRIAFVGPDAGHTIGDGTRLIEAEDPLPCSRPARRTHACGVGHVDGTRVRPGGHPARDDRDVHRPARDGQRAGVGRGEGDGR